VAAVARSFVFAVGATEGSDSAAIARFYSDAIRFDALGSPTGASSLPAACTPPLSSDIGSGVGTSYRRRR